ncbi:MAG: YbbR-like domain-containing protein [Vicinamibacterales bacterium]
MVYHPFRHFGLKIVSVAIAFLLWLTVAGEQVVERSIRIPLELQNIPENLEVVNTPLSTVDVRVRGSSGLLSQIDQADLVAVIDLSTVRAGRKIFNLSPEEIRAPFGIEVAQVSPSTVELEFEMSGRRSVAIQPIVEGQPAHGFEVASVTVEPPAVEVVGPRTALSNLDHVITEPVSVSGASREVREKVTIGTQAPNLRLESVRNALVTVQIRPIPMERTLKDVKVEPRNVAVGLAARVVPATVTVTVKGRSELLEALERQPLAAFVDLDGRVAGRYNLEVGVAPVTDVEILKIEPPTVRVTLR